MNYLDLSKEELIARIKTLEETSKTTHTATPKYKVLDVQMDTQDESMCWVTLPFTPRIAFMKVPITTMQALFEIVNTREKLNEGGYRARGVDYIKRYDRMGN